MIRALALALTVLTGFSGLVYEVTWQKYLATLLGSHSEATAAVLAIFLGGLSLGYWLFGVVTRRVIARAATAGKPARLLLLYGALEASVGLYALAFPWLFRMIQVLSYSIPHGVDGAGFLLDVLLATILIGPASVLMGGTIPILTQSLARSLDDATRFHALVYAFNTVGAFVGALAAGFYLVPQLGLEKVMLSIGGINLFAGGVFALLGVRGRTVVSLSQSTPSLQSTQSLDGEDRSERSRIAGLRGYVAVALLTGFAMLSMQTTVNRLAGLALGPSQFTFSMVVAVFVLSIALGSFAVSALHRIPRLVVVLNQWGIGLLFLLLYPTLDEAGYWVHLVRLLFRDTTAGFFGYHLLAFGLLLVVIGPPVILSGATLPLLFHQMRREVRHLGDLAGTLYSWNTIGSLLGALLGGYAFFFWLDLHQVYRISVAVLFLAALIVTSVTYSLKRSTAAVLWVVVLGSLAALPAWDPAHLYAGLYRHHLPGRDPYAGPEAFMAPIPGPYAPSILFHADDPIASVVVRDFSSPSVLRIRNISTDGKSDGDTDGDSITATLLALLPVLLADKAERAFVIGWGTGITAGVLASLDSIDEVHVAEISRSVLEAAPLFDFAALGASTNPKIHVIQSDAYRALMRSEATYDVIISEPSLVWSVGPEMLFTQEFLEAARSRLSPGGVYCQWIHGFENDDAALALVFRTFSSVYEHVSVWRDSQGAIVLLGFDRPYSTTVFYDLEQRAQQPEFLAALRRIGISDFSTLIAHELLPLDVLRAAGLRGPLHSIYHPRLNYLSAQAFFRGDTAHVPFTGFGEAARLGAANSLLRAYAKKFGGRLPDEMRAAVVLSVCRSAGAPCNALLAEWESEDVASTALESVLATVENTTLGLTRDEMNELAHLFARVKPERGAYTKSDEAERATERFIDLYHHAAPFRGEVLLDTWSRCREGMPTLESCRARIESNADAVRAGVETVERMVAECIATPGTSRMCQDGVSRAKHLLEDGPS